MSSLAVGRGLEGLELWLAGLFSAAELAAAELLLQLSADKGVDGDEAAVLSATESTSPRSATPGCGSEDLTVDEEEEAKLEAQEVEEEEKGFVEKPAASTELDRRARKRYRRLSDLYAAKSTVASTSTSTDSKKKRKRNHHHRNNDGFASSSSSESEATRYGGDYQ